MRPFVATPPQQSLRSGRALRAVLVAAAIVALLPTGCVRRRLNVRSNPPGALVFVDNQQIGTTPCSTDFTYYGTREIRLVKPGFETLTVNQPIPMPWYQIPPIDFMSENLVPNRITDHRTVSFDLQPQVIVPTEQLLDRANQLRQETQQTAATPPAMVVPPGGVVAPGAVSAPGVAKPGAAAPGGVMPSPTLAPEEAPGMVSPPGGFAPPPAYSLQPTYPPAATPTPLPPVSGSQPPTTYAPSTPAPLGTPPTPYGATPDPYGAAPYGSGPVGSTPAPFAAPTLPGTAAPIGAPAPQTLPPAGSQQGRPLVSPPLR